ncbi:MBL fold metallo-hydrolase, partial [Methanosarcinales archaeon]
FGDLGTLDLDYDKLKDIDIALIPVGGTFTIDAKEASQLIERIQPKIAIPMHYKTSKLGFSIDGVEGFLEGKENVEREEFLEIKKEELKYPTKIIVLKHLR